MRTILINPGDRTISEVDCDGKYETIVATLLRINGFNRGITCVRVSKIDDLWLDDCGMLEPGVPVFRMTNYPRALAGAGLLIAHNDEGDSAPTGIPLQMVRDVITWSDMETTGQLEPTTEDSAVIKIGDGILRHRGAVKS